MAYNVFFTVSGAGSDTGPFNISGTTNTGTVVLIDSNVPKATLESGYEITITNDNITGGTIQSVGTCTTSQPWEKPSMWLTVYGRDVAGSPANLTLTYSINGGGEINVPGYTGNALPSSCQSLYIITGLAQGDNVTFSTSTLCRINGAENTTSCPTSTGSATQYTTFINTPSPDSVAITIDSSINP